MSDQNGHNRFKPLGKRNAETAEVALKEMNKKLFEGLAIIAAQQKTVSDLVERVGKLENTLNMEKMNLTGLGPTVKP